MTIIGFPRSKPVDPNTEYFSREWHLFFVALLAKIESEGGVKRLAEGTALTGSSAIICTAPAKTTTTLKAVTVYNDTAGAVTLEMNLVANGGSVTAANRIISRSIAAKETYRCLEAVDHALAPGGTLRALGNGLSITVSGIETT